MQGPRPSANLPHGTTNPDTEDITEILSGDRLSGYRQKESPPVSDRVLLGRYMYNVAVSQGLYPYFHTLEVVLRNRVYRAVDAAYPIDVTRPELYVEYPCWLDATSSPVVVRHQGNVVTAKAEVSKDLRLRYGPQQAQATRYRTPGRLVAKLTFAFWVFMFDEAYSPVGRTPGLLWPGCYEDVFPYRGREGPLHVVRKRLRRLLVVRNRIMHYERIAPWTAPGDGAGALDPYQIHDDILDLVRWMSPRAAGALDQHGGWPPLYERYFRQAARRL